MAKVSIIVPCFNHARFLDDSINSILGQSYTSLEVIIIDDCSIDGSWQMIEKFANRDPRIKKFRHERNQGASKSRNDGLRAATGKFVAFCDADDIWESQKLSRQVELLEKNPDCDVVYCDTIIINENGFQTGQRFSERFPPPEPASGWLFPHLVRRNFINIQSVLMRKECLQDAGFFDERIKWVEDWWYWIQLSHRHRFVYSPKILAKYRVHSRSTNLVHQRAYSVNRLKVFRRILKNYEEICASDKAEIVYEMGVDLCRLGKYRSGQRFFWTTMHLARRGPRLFGRFCKALVRLCMCSVRL
jgi:glycosyltransferase involved in cell wall biosynthesis